MRIQGIIQNANGHPASGSVNVSIKTDERIYELLANARMFNHFIEDYVLERSDHNNKFNEILEFETDGLMLLAIYPMEGL